MVETKNKTNSTVVHDKPSQNKAGGDTAQTNNFAKNYWSWQVNDYQWQKSSSKCFTLFKLGGASLQMVIRH